MSKIKVTFINFPVAIFIFMAGYFIKPEKVNADYIINRGGRLLLPFLLWDIIYTVKNVLFGDNVEWKSVLFDFLTGRVAAPLYYILVLFQLTLLTPFILKKAGKKWLYLITPVYLCVIYIWTVIAGAPPRLYGTVFPAWLLFYLLGIDCRAGRLERYVQKSSGVWVIVGWYYNALHERNGDTDPARIVIGKDTRRSSYMFEYSLVAGLTASGADAYLLHVTTTPSVAYIARVDDFDCGIMISASHNPYYDNGIKLIDCYGEKMPEETLLLVEDYIDGQLHVFDQDWSELPFAHREHIGCTVDYVAGRNRYMGYLISLGIYSFKGVKVGLDCANGSSWNIAKSVFDALGADTYVINAQPNGLNINLNAGSTHIEGLQKFVVEKGLDVGFAFDGDADRCLCVDEKGNVITGDHILYIYGCYMKERGKLLNNTVVTTVMSNFGLYKAFDEQGIGYAKTAVGDKYVYEYMAKNGCRIGGEQSGHIIFSKYASTGDGILTSLKMMEVMLAKKKPMSELAAPLKIYPQVLENVRVTDKKAAQNDETVQAAVKNVAEALGDTGRILVRESGTEPVVRVMVEAPDHDTCQKYVSEVVDVIRDRGYSL